MKFIHAVDSSTGIHDLSDRLIAELKQDKKVLWLICGGSNIAPAVEIMKKIRANVSPDQLTNLTVSQTDERYGPVGHPDSNWKQMQDAGFDFEGIKTLPVLRGLLLEETVKALRNRCCKSF